MNRFKFWYAPWKFTVTFASWAILVYVFFAASVHDIWFILPLASWLPIWGLVCLWLLFWLIVVLTKLTKGAWLFFVPTNIFLAYWWWFLV